MGFQPRCSCLVPSRANHWSLARSEFLRFGFHPTGKSKQQLMVRKFFWAESFDHSRFTNKSNGFRQNSCLFPTICLPRLEYRLRAMDQPRTTSGEFARDERYRVFLEDGFSFVIGRNRAQTRISSVPARIAAGGDLRGKSLR